MSESPSAPGAVFLSYASQDADAAKHICEALRAAGVEVWFDQSELVGGDQWDGKIRGQISSCALFVPIISAATQARREGYFRIEWRLAAQRTHAMSDDTTFLLPIVIDETGDAEAKVPVEFKSVQWTRLKGGETSAAFCERVKKLLDGNVGASLDDVRGRAQGAPLQEPRGTPRRSSSKWWWALPIFGVAMAMLLILKEGHKDPPPSISTPGVVKPVEPSKTAAPPTLSPSNGQSEARQLAEKAMQTGGSSAGLLAAADLAEKATHLDATDAEVWALAAMVDIRCWVSADRTERRAEMALAKVMRAKGLAPRSITVRFAEARMLTELELYPDGGAKAEPLLRELLKENTDERTKIEITGVLGLAVGKQGRGPEAARLLEEAGRTDPNWMRAASWRYLLAGMLPEALRAARQNTVMQRTDGLIMQMIVQEIREDLDAVRDLLGQIPESERIEELPASAMVMVSGYKREPEPMLAAAKLLPGDYLQNQFLDAPKAAILAMAYTLAGRNEAAQLHWKTALAVVDARLATRGSDPDFLGTRLVVLAKLGRQEEAEQVYRLLKELLGPQAYFDEAFNLAALGRKEESLAALTEALRRKSNLFGHLTARYHPNFDLLRGDPRFEKLLRETLPPDAKPFDDPKPAVVQITATDDKSLVVLPLENLSPDPENAFFTEGMHAEIIATLQRTTDLRVIGRDSALALKRGSGSLAELAARVGAANVMTGSVRRSGNKVLILLELRRARDEALLWASPNTVRELGADIFGLQAEVAREVVRVLQARERKGWGADAEFRTSNAQALDLFLKAQQIFRSNFATTSDTRMPAAISLLEESLRLDPHFVSAMQMLSVARVDRYRFSENLRERAVHAAEGKRWAEAAAREVSGGAGDNALYFYCQWVENDLVRALELSDNFIRAVPNDAAGWNGRGLIMTGLGRPEEALAAYDRSILLDPLWVVTRTNKYFMLARQRRRPEAEAMLPDILPLLEDRTRPTHNMIQAHFCLTGESAPVDHLSIRLQVAWLGLFRKPAEQLALVERELAMSNLDEGTEFYWRRYQCEALQRLGRAAEADQPAHRMLVLAEKIEGMPEVDPVDKQRRMARALLATGQTKEAAAAAQRAIEIDRRRGVMTQLWTDQAMLAEIYAQAGQKAECFTLLRALLQVPNGLTVPVLRATPMWDPVRDDPEFKALLNDPKNDTPL